MSSARPPYDPDLEERVLAARLLTLFATDGLTHAMVIATATGETASWCGNGDRLSRNWRLVNCDACRAKPDRHGPLDAVRPQSCSRTPGALPPVPVRAGPGVP